jgi:hypothetical protein
MFAAKAFIKTMVSFGTPYRDGYFNRTFILQPNGRSTNTSAVELLNGNNARSILEAKSIWNCIVYITAIKSDGTKSATWVKAVTIKRDNSNNTALIGTVTDVVAEKNDGSPSYTISITADDTNEALKIEFTNATDSESTYVCATIIGNIQNY